MKIKIFLRSMVVSDECVSQLPRRSNKQNGRNWGTENPRECREHAMQSEKIAFGCAAHANGALNPYYFDNQTVSGADHNYLLYTYVRAQGPKFPGNALFQKDGASPHTNRQARALLNDIFPDSWVGKYGM